LFGSFDLREDELADVETLLAWKFADVCDEGGHEFAVFDHNESFDVSVSYQFI
jgi:hypothetical protein